MKPFTLIVSALLAAAAIACSPAGAQTSGAKPVSVIVPFSPGAAPTYSRGRWRPGLATSWAFP